MNNPPIADQAVAASEAVPHPGARLSGKAALIVGAATPGNIAQGIARRFAREGAHVMVAGRREAPLRQLASEIGGAFCVCDITKKVQIDSMVRFTVERFGRLDIGVNCTGWGLLVPFEDTTEEQLLAMMDLQFKGPFQFMQALVRVMPRGGSIIMISTATSRIMFEQHSAYMGTKAGIDHVVRTVANEFGSKGIRANSISPGITNSPMAASLAADPTVLQAFVKCYPLGRIGTIDDIAASAAWLASDECFMTGQNLQVNGGLTLRRNPTFEEMGPTFDSAARGLRGVT
ncbi:MAG: Oxidoreductase [Gammaproteobacteria bacterium]|nr:Oxidoreductase [Gammaproteobacteria bacterium]